MQLDGQKALMPRAPGMERRTVAGFSRHLKKCWRSAISGLLICLMMLAV
jgi:hypothetical protein